MFRIKVLYLEHSFFTHKVAAESTDNTKASDVWSYGTVLYNVWTLGKDPPEHLSKEEVIQT